MDKSAVTCTVDITAELRANQLRGTSWALTRPYLSTLPQAEALKHMALIL